MLLKGVLCLYESKVSHNMADSRGRTFTCIRCEDLFTYFWRGSPEEVEQRHKSRQIDKTLKREDRARKRQVRFISLNYINFLFILQHFHKISFRNSIIIIIIK